MKRKACMIIALLVAVITASNIAYMIKDEFFYKLDNLPEGKLLRDEINQNILFSEGTWLQVYEIEPTQNHPAAIRVAVRNERTGENRTIYWQIGTRESLIYWPEDQESTVIINGVPIDYTKGMYDCRDYKNFKYVPDDSVKNGDF